MTRLLLILVVSTSVVHAQDYSYDEHSETRGIETLTERVTLGIMPVKTRVADERETILPAIAAVAVPLIDVGMSALKANLEKRSKEYQASYRCANSADAFYESRQFVNLPELTIRRSITVPDRSSTTGSRSMNALIIELTPELSADRHAFRYKVKSVTMNYSKARTKGRFDYIDVQLDVVFRSLAIEGPKQDVINLRAFSLIIPSVKPHTLYDPESLPRTNWLPFPPPLQVAKGTANFDGTGLYEFSIGITESNPYKVRAQHKQHLVEKSSSGLSSVAAEIAEQIKATTK